MEEIDQKSYNDLNDKSKLPKIFKETNKRIFPDGRPEEDWETACEIAIWLIRNIKGGPGLSDSSEVALDKMLNGCGGVCSDMVQVFNNFCVLNDIKVREWGSTRRPFDSRFTGHSFNEVYSKEDNRWIMIDPSYGFYLTTNDTPLSVIQLANAKGNKELVRRIYLEEFREIEDSMIDWIYFNENTSLFLVSNYSNKLYDQFISFFKPVLPIFVIHFMIYLIGRSYHYLFPLIEE